jgi:hypothetical protein
MPIRSHWRLDGLLNLHPKLLSDVLRVLGLGDVDVVLLQLDLESKEELQFAHHGQLKHLDHYPTKFFTRRLISRAKNNIIDINLVYK